MTFVHGGKQVNKCNLSTCILRLYLSARTPSHLHVACAAGVCWDETLPLYDYELV